MRRCFAFLTTSCWSYNQALQAWEPVIEPWQLLLHLDTNPRARAVAGVPPGTWLRATSTHGCMHVTLAHAAVTSLLDAGTDWAPAGGGGASGGGDAAAAAGALVAADGLATTAAMYNSLDVTAYMQLDYGHGRREVVAFPPRAWTRFLQPMAQPPPSHAPLPAGVPPPVRLVVDVGGGELLAGAEAVSGSSAPELYVRIAVAGAVAERLARGAAAGMATRAIPAADGPGAAAGVGGGAGAGPGGRLEWGERFMLALPAALAEQLLTPAPGDNPFEGAALQLELSVYDVSTSGATAALVGTATLQVGGGPCCRSASGCVCWFWGPIGAGPAPAPTAEGRARRLL